ncbi:protein of unknown function [Rhizobium mongolense subsp. loessense]|uniref:YjiS-like domain-containing protein n=1 Tax=Rhizobium mongolense subsp. loessense TaxID=158890 RepID=A0A1G4QLM9_9HYPH|nr:protein of unknown function [Rhizobium mongolense subsp. loessense]
MTSATKRPLRTVEWMPLKILRAVIGTFGGRGEPPAISCALSALNDHLLKDIGVSRLEIDFGHLAPADRCCLASSLKTDTRSA